MLRNIVAAFAAFALFVGGVYAEEIKGTFVKFEEKKLTIKVGDKDETFVVSDDAKVKLGKKEGKVIEAFAKKAPKEGAPLVVVVDDKKVVTEVKFEKKKKDNN